MTNFFIMCLIPAVDGGSLKFVESSSYDSTDADIDKNADYDFDDPNLEKSPIESIADEEESDSRRSHASVFGTSFSPLCPPWCLPHQSM